MFAIAAAALALAGSPQEAPSAEQVVAYLVHGLERGAIPRFGQQTDNAMTLVSTSPAVFESTGPSETGEHSETLRFIVTRLDDCTYSSEQQFEEDGAVFARQTYTLHLASVSAIAMTNPPAYVDLKGLRTECVTDTAGSCDLTRDAQSVGPFFGEPGRAQQAIDYFHAHFCALAP